MKPKRKRKTGFRDIKSKMGEVGDHEKTPSRERGRHKKRVKKLSTGAASNEV